MLVCRIGLELIREADSRTEQYEVREYFEGSATARTIGIIARRKCNWWIWKRADGVKGDFAFQSRQDAVKSLVNEGVYGGVGFPGLVSPEEKIHMGEG